MKLVTFTAQHDTEQDTRPSFGLVEGQGVIDLGRRIGARFPTLKALIAGDGFAEAAASARGQKPDYSLDEIAFLPTIPDPGKILCVGLNYKAHREETGRAPTDNPALFIRFPDSQTGHRQPLVKPAASDKLDYEGELAVIIGREGRHVAAMDALSIVAGYSIYNDGSVRDFQNHTLQWTAGKNFPATGGFGPWMVTADELGDPTLLRLTTRLNDTIVQDTTTDLMLFDIPTLIAYITTFTTLRPGDVISTGTPGGVGFKREPQLFMKAGDRVSVEISGIGTLENLVQAERLA